MAQEFSFDNEEKFLKKLKELRANGLTHHKLETFTPYPVHGLEDVLDSPPSPQKFFTLFGALTGMTIGFCLTIGTVLDWPLVVGGKPLVSIPPFIVIAYELTILLGGVISFLGFLLLNRLPKFTRFIPEKEYGNKFVIVVEGDKQ